MRIFPKVIDQSFSRVLIAPILEMIFFIGLSFGHYSSSWAQEDESTDTFEFFAQEAKTITASRRMESAANSVVSVEVITQEDIRFSKALSIADLLRFRMGLDVVDGRSTDIQRHIVSIRGFAQEYVDNLQVLIDGRSIVSPVGGVYWAHLPVNLEDIERIEIVRGPNAALYGSNAALGVINIITKKRNLWHDRQASLWGGSREAIRGYFSSEHIHQNRGLRLGYGYETENGFSSVGGSEANDYFSAQKANLRGWWSPGSGSLLEIFAGGNWSELGAVNTLNSRGRMPNYFAMVRYLDEFTRTTSLELTTSRADTLMHLEPYEFSDDGTISARVLQYDAEALLRSGGWLDGLAEMTAGVNYRNILFHSHQLFGIDNHMQRNEIIRGFVNQSVHPTEKLSLIGAYSLEESDVSGVEPAYQIAILYRLAQGQTLRLNNSYSTTLPSIHQARAQQSVPSNSMLIQGNPDLEPQKMRSYEAGYQKFWLGQRVLTEAAVFYMDIHDFSESYIKEMVFSPTVLITTSYRNVNRAIARGAEAKAKYAVAPGRHVYANYTFERVSDNDNDNGLIRSVPRHKVNMGGNWALGGKFSLGIDAGYKDVYVIESLSRGNVSLSVPAYWRLDARVIYEPTDQVEVFAAGRNLTRSAHREFPDGLEVPRVFYGGMNVRF